MSCLQLTSTLRWVTLTSFILFSNIAWATHSTLQFKQPALIKAQSALFDMDFDKALGLLQSDPKCNTLEFLYVQHYALYLQYWVHKSTHNFDVFEKQSERINTQIHQLKSVSPDFLMVNADIQLQLAWLSLSNHAYFQAAKHFKEALNLSKQCRSLFPNYTPILKIEGWLQATAGAVPKSYHLGVKALGVKPDLAGGLEKLQDFCNNSRDFMPPIVKNNARFALLYLHIHLLNTPNKAVELSRQYWVDPSNALSDYMRIHILNEANQSKELLAQIQAFKLRYPFSNPYLDLLQGIAYTQNASFSKAIPLLQSYLSKNTSGHYNAYAQYYLALSLYLNGEKEEGVKTMNHVSKQRNAKHEKDKQAIQDASRFDPKEVELIKARLLFDGEEYPNALSVLQSIEGLAGFNQTEILYRKARCFQMLNQTDSALHYYSKTIQNGGNSPRYFAAYAAFQTACIYELQGHAIRALHYFNSVLTDFSANQEYQKSIEQKAKAGIQRLSK